VGLQIVSAGGYGILFHPIVNLPDLRSIIIRRIADEDDLEQWFVGFQFDRMMELGNEGAQFFQEGYADLLEVLLGGACGDSMGIHSAKVGDFQVEPNRPGLRGDLPFGCAEENTDVAGVNGGDAGRNRFGLERAIDGGENDGVICDMDDGAAPGEIGDDFVFLSTDGSARRECGQKNQGGANVEVVHKGRVAQREDYGIGVVRGMVSE